MLTCKICEYEGKQLHQHIKYKHSMTVDAYKQKYGECKMQIVTDETIQNRNTISHFQVSYWMKYHGYTKSEAENKVSEIQQSNNSKRKYNRNEMCLCKEYWIEKHNFSESDAIKKIQQIQSDRSARSSKFSGHKHSAESKRKIGIGVSTHIQKTGVDKRIMHFGDQTSYGISNIEIECYNELKSFIPELESNVIINPYVVDMIFNKHIIEFNGTYWHADPRKYNELDELKFPKNTMLAKDIWSREKKRTEFLIQQGYSVFVIWENDWKQNKQHVIKEVKQYYVDCIKKK